MNKTLSGSCVLGLLVLALGSGHRVHAGSRWAKVAMGTGNEGWYAIAQTSDGGYIVSGQTESYGAGGSDAWCAKLDSKGDPVWQRSLGGVGNEILGSVQQTSDGGYIAAGWTSSSGSGGLDGWCVKLDGVGAVSWQKTYGGSTSDSIAAVQQTSDGGYVMAGSTRSSGAGSSDAWCLKIDPAGNPVWQRTYGGSASDTAGAVVQTSDGGYIVAGGTSSFGAGGLDVLCLRLDPSGNVLWQKTYGGAGTDPGVAVTRMADGDYMLLAYTDSFGAGALDAWCLKLDTSGNPVWQKTYGGGGNDWVISASGTTDGGLVMVGGTESSGAGSGDGWCLRLNGSGEMLWEKTYGGPFYDTLECVRQTKDGGYVACGAVGYLNGISNDAWAVKLDNYSDGEIHSSCGSLVQTSAAAVSDTAVTAADAASAVSNSTATGSPSGGVLSDSSATFEFACAAPASPDLTASWSSLKAVGARVTGTLAGLNAGDLDAGSFGVRVYLSRKPGVSRKSTLVKQVVIDKADAGAGFSLKVKTTKGSKHKYIVAVVDADNGIAEDNELNNVASGRL